MSVTHELKLTDEEIVVLDGKCNEETQKAVNDAKSRLAMGVDSLTARFVSDVLKEAAKNKKLIFLGDNLTYCSYCKKSGGYAKYPRDGKYHRKGQSNYDKPLYFRGVELADSFIRMKGHTNLGCCLDCWSKFKDTVRKLLKDVEAEIPEELTGFPPKYKRWNIKKCKCGWTGPEYEMIQNQNFYGQLYYNECPSCNIKNDLFNYPISSTSDYVIKEIN